MFVTDMDFNISWIFVFNLKNTKLIQTIFASRAENRAHTPKKRYPLRRFSLHSRSNNPQKGKEIQRIIRMTDML